MTDAVQALGPGQRVTHLEFGDGVIFAEPTDGFVRVFFALGERQVPLESLRGTVSRAERLLSGVAADSERGRRAWLAIEAHALPLMDSASSLTAAKVDLLPHQIVLTHRIAVASPRRFLVADEVGLGKTIETALILRELASRGELRRALIVVPAGLVNNWHRELNEVFRLNFEVFGSEGDVTDRKTNAFAKHDRLIASVDTLKQERRIKRLLEAPQWDLVVFDEAHHLTAYRAGKKVTKTENYKLAEALKGHARDLLLLSATPHQGDHFRFWMLVQLLNPTLFNSPEEMVENRHRLNEVVFRRTKADACRADGAPLFARREVHTDSFTMTGPEEAFYAELLGYLQDGFALAKRQGNKGRALGFVMAIFQKIAASSFAAVRTTLRRRLLALTVHEAVLRDKELDIDGRQALYDEARALIREDHGLGGDLAASNEVERILTDWKAVVIQQVEEAAFERAADSFGSEGGQTGAEDLVAKAVNLALPEERLRILKLLERFPIARETKVVRLLDALGQLWNENPAEKVVLFATYLATVDMLSREIEQAFPGKGVVVLRGGDHGAKLAAEKRFRLKDGPRVMVCTAAGREGINLQFARVLFNFDLPWNPMDVEQRIGRIHRYGQRDTAQVYNLILSDTIEGKIFLLLNDKLQEIARALGKVDERGEVAEDLRAQILGQLSERLRYDQLYQQAISDPELRRTRLEVESALKNASEARQVVFSLFQDLDGFNLDDYKPLADTAGSLDRMLRYFGAATADTGRTLATTGPGRFEVRDGSGTPLLRFTTDRDLAREDDTLDLFGLDHPLMQEALRRWREVAPESLGLAVPADHDPAGVLTAWLVETHGPRSERRAAVQFLAADGTGRRLPAIERKAQEIFARAPVVSPRSVEERKRVLGEIIEPMLQREVQQRRLSPDKGGFSSQLIGWVEVIP